MIVAEDLMVYEVYVSIRHPGANNIILLENVNRMMGYEPELHPQCSGSHCWVTAPWRNSKQAKHPVAQR